MDEEQKNRIATFRFSVVCDFVNGARLEHGEREKLLADKCGRKWNIPYSEKTSIGRSTILRWIKLYEEGGGRLESLRPRDRSDKGKSRSVDEETESALVNLRKEFPAATAERMIEIMDERKLVTPGTVLNLPNVYRLLHGNDLMRPKAGEPEDCRKFEARYPNDLWQSDVMHGPHVEFEGKRKKTYLIGIIDDHSRLIPHARFCFSEKLDSFIDVFQTALFKRGVPRKLYVDNGAAFRSNHLAHACASLGIALIHARPYRPQGKGKIERWFKTVRSSFLQAFAGSAIEELNADLQRWLERYHERRHGSTGRTPHERFVSGIQCVRAAPQNLKDCFRKTARRKVAKDRTVTLHGRLFEVPVCLIGKRVELLWHESDPGTVEIVSDKKSCGRARPVDVHANCKVERDGNGDADIVSEAAPKYRGGRLWSKKGGEG